MPIPSPLRVVSEAQAPKHLLLDAAGKNTCEKQWTGEVLLAGDVFLPGTKELFRKR